MSDLLTDPYIAELRAMHAQIDSILSQLERDHPTPAKADKTPSLVAYAEAGTLLEIEA